METAEMIGLYEAGLSLIAIAQQAGVTHGAVHSRLRRNGVALRGRGHPKGQPPLIHPEQMKRELPLDAVRSLVLMDARRYGFDDVVRFLGAEQ